MAGAGFRASAPTAIAGVLAAALVGTGAVFALLETMNPFADWFLVFGSNPFEMCGFAIPPVPSEAPCLAQHYGELGWRIVFCLVFVGLPIWWGLRSAGRMTLLSLVFAWAAAGFVVEMAYLVWGVLGEPPLPVHYPLLLPLEVWGYLARLGLLAALIAAMMAGVFCLVTRRAGGHQARREGAR